MKKRTILLIFSVLLSFGVMAQQNEKTTEMRLSLQEACKYALENNRTLMNASLDVRMAQAARWQTIASMLPQVDASLGYQNMCGYKMNFGGMEIPMNPTGNLDVTASIAINGQMVVGALLNNLAIDMQNINNSQTELDIVTNVEQIYMSILVMQKTIGILESSTKNLEDLYQSTLGSVQAGVVEQTTADQIQVQVANMRSSINSTKRSLEVLNNSLALQLSCGIDKTIVLTDSIDELVNSEEALRLLSADFDMENSYSYQLAEKNVKLAKHNKTMAVMAYIPTLSMYYQYSAKTYFGEAEGMNMTPPNMVGVTLSVPIFASGKRGVAMAEKNMALQQAYNTFEDAKDGLNMQNKQLRYNLTSAYEDFDIQKFNIEVSQRIFDNTANKFEYGYASSIELTEASTSLLTAQSNYIQSYLNLVNAQLELKKLLNINENRDEIKAEEDRTNAIMY